MIFCLRETCEERSHFARKMEEEVLAKYKVHEASWRKYVWKRRAISVEDPKRYDW